MNSAPAASKRRLMTLGVARRGSRVAISNRRTMRTPVPVRSETDHGSRFSDSIGTIAAALAKAQTEVTNPVSPGCGATCSAFWLVMRSILVLEKNLRRQNQTTQIIPSSQMAIFRPRWLRRSWKWMRRLQGGPQRRCQAVVCRFVDVQCVKAILIGEYSAFRSFKH